MTNDTPLAYRLRVSMPPPTASDRLSDGERLSRAIADCGVADADIPLYVARALPGILRESGFDVTATLSGGRVISVGPGTDEAACYGLAIDLGTTNVVGALIEMSSGEVVAESSEPNPQIAHGEDILTRIHYCLNDGGINELSRLAVECITALADRLAEQAGIAAQDISAVTVSGNTTMAHLLLGLDPYGICRAPYVPVANRFDIYRAMEIGIGVNPEAPVHVFPNVGSYVGGDVLAGILVSGIHEADELSVMVDVGTNAEIVIGNRDWLLVCAGAAGPALEGGVVRHGMRAMPGAIDRITIDRDSLEPAYTVLGGAGVRPLGMCGSALIDLMAELFLSGLIDGRGRFIKPYKSPRVALHEGKPVYVVAPVSESGTGSDVVFTENDIENLIRTKAAMYTVLYVVTRELGIGFNDLARFHIAGTFGAYISADKAVAIGMVPDIELTKYNLLGNSSIKGAIEALRCADALAELGRIASLITYKEMNVSSEFMTEFRAAMFLPHTDASHFPSVAGGV
jgi:uncharacterized 2Fe-2S/4Fe-4S cluster protein (DUF4445 family)